MSTYRTGGHWGVTIVREGDGPEDVMGHHSGDQLVAVVVNGDQALAERICTLLNGEADTVALLATIGDLTPEEFDEFRAAFRQAIVADSQKDTP